MPMPKPIRLPAHLPAGNEAIPDSAPANRPGTNNAPSFPMRKSAKFGSVKSKSTSYYGA